MVQKTLTTEQWEAGDYRQPAREVDAWAESKGEPRRSEDSTEYVAKIGLNADDSVVLMNRAHDRVVVPPPVRAKLAAFALANQPFGFSSRDVSQVREAADASGKGALAKALHDLADRLEALAPPAG